MNVLIVAGGSGPERKISLLSARNIKKALEENNLNTYIFDFRDGISKLKTLQPRFDIIFPVLHGKEGEDGVLYKLLKSFGTPYIGSEPEGANVAFNKIAFKKYVDKKKIPTARWKVIRNISDLSKFKFPLVLKAAYGGSSKEVILLKSRKDLKLKKVQKLLKLENKFYVEQLLAGPEITIGVLRDTALPPVEIIPPKDGWFDYKNKYSGESREIVGAPSVKKEVIQKAQEISLNIHKELNLGQYSRTDFIVVNDVPYILETNTPGGVGMTKESLFPKAALGLGITFPELVKKIVSMR